MQLRSADLVTAIQGDVPIDDLIGLLRESPDRSKEVLTELARHRDPVVRAWVPGVARTVLGRQAIPLIVRLAKGDRDADVRDVAIEQLLDLDRTAAESLIPLFKRKLESDHPFEPLTAMWALAAVGDRGSIELIRKKIAGRQVDALDRITGEVVITMLTNPSEISRRIRSHDHSRMIWLTRAAALLHTQAAADALRDCAASAPDDQCRGYCRENLERLERSKSV